MSTWIILVLLACAALGVTARVRATHGAGSPDVRRSAAVTGLFLAAGLCTLAGLVAGSAAADADPTAAWWRLAPFFGPWLTLGAILAVGATIVWFLPRPAVRHHDVGQPVHN